MIITALPEERDAVLSKLGKVEQVPGAKDRREVYFSAELKPKPLTYGESGQNYAIKVLCLPGMGRVAGALAASNAIHAWHPQYVLLVGIAGGFAPEAQLGDVLISDQILDYELQKVGTNTVEFRPNYPPVNHRLLHAAQNYIDSSWLSLVTQSRPQGSEPSVVFGTVATGDKVVNNQVMIDQLKGLPRRSRLVGVEMEAGGATAAAHQNETGFLMIDGVSDAAGWHERSRER